MKFFQLFVISVKAAILQKKLTVSLSFRSVNFFSRPRAKEKKRQAEHTKKETSFSANLTKGISPKEEKISLKTCCIMEYISIAQLYLV